MDALSRAAFLLVLASVVNALGPFENDDPNNSENIALTREALEQLGYQTDGLHLIEFHSKWWVIQWNYRVIYTLHGEMCSLRFKWKKLIGLVANHDPHCFPIRPDNTTTEGPHRTTKAPTTTAATTTEPPTTTKATTTEFTTPGKCYPHKKCCPRCKKHLKIKEHRREVERYDRYNDRTSEIEADVTLQRANARKRKNQN